MQPCYTVEITTPKKFILNGLWFGPYSAKATKGKPQKPKRVLVWVHGLGSTMFSKLAIAEKLVGGGTAVLVFNNRGHDTIVNVPTTGKKCLKAGAAHEKFTDSADDIQGAINFARKQGVKSIFLAGHSTGCQKSVYWASGKKGRGAKGMILLAPMSDYSAHRQEYGAKKVAKAVAYAQTMARRGNGQQLLPPHVWDWPWSAQRFLSLYSGKGAEEIFTYWDAKENPKTLKSVRLPILVMLAEKEEFSHIPANTIAAWFEKHLNNPRGDTSWISKVVVVSGVGHSFKGGEKKVAAHIRSFMQ